MSQVIILMSVFSLEHLSPPLRNALFFCLLCLLMCLSLILSQTLQQNCKFFLNIVNTSIKSTFKTLSFFLEVFSLGAFCLPVLIWTVCSFRPAEELSFHLFFPPHPGGFPYCYVLDHVSWFLCFLLFLIYSLVLYSTSPYHPPPSTHPQPPSTKSFLVYNIHAITAFITSVKFLLLFNSLCWIDLTFVPPWQTLLQPSSSIILFQAPALRGNVGHCVQQEGVQD